jgi:signal transduction histidine kinase
MLGAGAKDYLTKPFSAEELRARVGNLISTRRTRAILEGDLKGSRESLEALAERLVRSRDAAEAALHVRDDFIAMASHELRTPLTAMKLHNAQARRLLARPGGLDPTAVAAAFARADQLMNRLQTLIATMLDLSHISAGTVRVNPAEADLCALAREVVDRHNDPGQQRIIVTCPTAPVVGVWDAGRLDQVLTNLLTNALGYGQGKRVTVGVTRTARSAVLSVTDEGIGIRAEDQPRIFERFERAVPRDGSPGLGLGLYIARTIVELHGGTLSVHSELGSGATFTVELPLSS